MSDSQLIPITFSPGINRNLTPYNAEGSYMDGDKVRFKSGKAEKIGGWVRNLFIHKGFPETETNQSSFLGVPRATHAWVSLIGRRYLGVGTHNSLEVLEDDSAYDITPIASTKDDLNNAFSYVEDEDIVTVNYGINHNLVEGARIVVVSQATDMDGINLGPNKMYYVDSIVDSTTFTIKIPHIFTATASGVGGDIEISLILNPGNIDNTTLGGWGVGRWGEPGLNDGGWGDPRSGEERVNLRLWKLSNWGENLTASVSNGGIYKWSPTDDGFTVRASLIPNAPTRNLFAMVVLPSRHIVAFGSTYQISGEFDPLLVKWCASEQYINWDILDTENDAGEYRLPLGNTIIGAIQTKGETIIFTDTQVYSMRFVGLPDVFIFTPLGSNSGPISMNCCIDLDGIVYWQSVDGFYRYNGVIENVTSSLDNAIFKPFSEFRINFQQKEKACIGLNRSFNEVMFFYPTLDNLENNRYVIYNYAENIWYDGWMQRNTWLDQGVFRDPIALDYNGHLFNHEVGKNANGASLNAFVRSAYFDLGEGTEFVHVDRLIPDLEFPTNTNVEVSVFYKRYPQASVENSKGPFSFNKNTEKINLRVRGRQLSILYRSNTNNGDFRLGKNRIGIIPDGFR